MHTHLSFFFFPRLHDQNRPYFFQVCGSIGRAYLKKIENPSEHPLVVTWVINSSLFHSWTSFFMQWQDDGSFAE
ncbi:hypothetical protein [Simkania negevensis]|uniref:Uncharacterized protein n=1 Tax=Simkania negevensis (strain ATCC VR-1471 / DSM 27360 / Z) TaxID=331113 RepID=F8L482_SIMNZ|nr:hypothetical protein [Simkania negevensis]CCB90127.1 unknown protein [Simkania negevensis Z]